MTKIKEKLLKIFFSEICIICEKSGETICKRCLENIKLDKYNINNINKINWVKSCFSYKNKNIHLAFIYLKYFHTKSIAKYLAEISYILFLNFINDILYKKKNSNTNSDSDSNCKSNIDYDDKNIIIIPIPISKKRKLERGYNQSEILIKEILKKMKEKENINLENNLYIDLLIKNKHTIKFAHTHSHTDREKFIKDAFIINEKYKTPSGFFIKSQLPQGKQNSSNMIDNINETVENNFLKDKIIFLIDDITTTGATLYEARNTLMQAGIKKENIFGFVLAH